MEIIQSLSDYETNTLILYVAIIFVATALACVSQSKLITIYSNSAATIYRKFRPIPFVLSFSTLAFFAAATANGVDRTTYLNMFLDISWDTIGNGQELGYNVFMLLIKVLTDNPVVFCAIVHILTVAFMYIGFYSLRKDLCIGFAVFIYSSQYYIQSYNLMRMYFALSIIFAGVGLLRKKRYIRYFVVLAIATLIHYSTVFVMGAFLLALIYIKAKNCSLGVHIVWSILLAMFVFFAVLYGVDVLKSINSPIIEKYLIYLENVNINSIGFMWVFKMVPSVIVIYLAKRYKDEYNFRKIAVAFIIVSTLIDLLSYSVPVLGRATKMVSFNYLVYYPYITELYSKSVLSERSKPNGRRTAAYGLDDRRICYILIAIGVLYNLFQMVLYFGEYRLLDGIDNYRFIWEICL